MSEKYLLNSFTPYILISKGAYGECGLRGGYMELHNMEPELIDEIYKVTSINLCPNVPGQVAVGLMVNPPKPGEYILSVLLLVVTAAVTSFIISSSL